MANIDEYLASRQCMWDEFTASGNIMTKVSEIRQLEASSTRYRTLTHAIALDRLNDWLSGISDVPLDDESSDQETDACIVRVLWVPFNRKTGKIDLGHGILDQATQAFHHHLAQSRLRATFAGAAWVTEPSNGSRSYWYCNHPHLAITWSRVPGTQVMNWIITAQDSKIDILQDLLSCQFIQELTEFELLPLLLCMILLCREIDDVLNNIKGQVRQAEVRTGYHAFQSRAEAPASGDLLQLSAAMSGHASTLAVLTRRLGIFGELGKLVDEAPARIEGGVRLAGVASVLGMVRQHAAMQQLDVDFFKQRTQTQREALLHLLSEHGSLAHTRIAIDSHNLAKLAQSDTSTMKALAWLAVVFVPPTFVASLFSIPIFDWGFEGKGSEDSPPPWERKLLLYFSVTGPLLLITFSIWGVYYLWMSARRCARTDRSRQIGESGGSEIISLIAKRYLADK